VTIRGVPFAGIKHGKGPEKKKIKKTGGVKTYCFLIVLRGRKKGLTWEIFVTGGSKRENKEGKRDLSAVPTVHFKRYGTGFFLGSSYKYVNTKRNFNKALGGTAKGRPRWEKDDANEK